MGTAFFGGKRLLKNQLNFFVRFDEFIQRKKESSDKPLTYLIKACAPDMNTYINLISVSVDSVNCFRAIPEYNAQREKPLAKNKWIYVPATPSWIYLELVGGQSARNFLRKLKTICNQLPDSNTSRIELLVCYYNWHFDLTTWLFYCYLFADRTKAANKRRRLKKREVNWVWHRNWMRVSVLRGDGISSLCTIKTNH